MRRVEKEEEAEKKRKKEEKENKNKPSRPRCKRHQPEVGLLHMFPLIWLLIGHLFNLLLLLLLPSRLWRSFNLLQSRGRRTSCRDTLHKKKHIQVKSLCRKIYCTWQEKVFLLVSAPGKINQENQRRLWHQGKKLGRRASSFLPLDKKMCSEVSSSVSPLPRLD